MYKRQGSLYSVESQSQEDAYLWQDILTDTDEDTPQGLWDECYLAIASANHEMCIRDSLLYKSMDL